MKLISQVPSCFPGPFLIPNNHLWPSQLLAFLHSILSYEYEIASIVSLTELLISNMLRLSPGHIIKFVYPIFVYLSVVSSSQVGQKNFPFMPLTPWGPELYPQGLDVPWVFWGEHLPFVLEGLQCLVLRYGRLVLLFYVPSLERKEPRKANTCNNLRLLANVLHREATDQNWEKGQELWKRTTLVHTMLNYGWAVYTKRDKQRESQAQAIKQKACSGLMIVSSSSSIHEGR